MAVHISWLKRNSDLWLTEWQIIDQILRTVWCTLKATLPLYMIFNGCRILATNTPNKFDITLNIVALWRKIVAAIRGMHVSPAKQSYAWLPRKSDYWTDRKTDGQTDAGQSDPYVPLCFAGDTTSRSESYSHLMIYMIYMIWRWGVKGIPTHPFTL